MGTAVARIFLPMMRLAIPELVDVNLPIEAVFHNLMIVSIRKSYPGQARKVFTSTSAALILAEGAPAAGLRSATSSANSSAAAAVGAPRRKRANRAAISNTKSKSTSGMRCAVR